MNTATTFTMNTAIAILWVSLLVSQVSAAPSLTLDVSVPFWAFGTNRLTLKTRLKNTGDVPLKLMKNPDSILSAAKTNKFKILSKTCTPQFTGLNVRYDLSHAAKPIKASDYVLLAPGKTTEVKHNLAGAYDFTQCGGGVYTITASNTFYYIDGSGKPNIIKASTRSGQLKVTSKAASPTRHAKTGTLSKRDLKFIGCKADQKKQIEEAVNKANAMIVEANTYLARLPSSPSKVRYTTWFGAINKLRYKYVTSNFKSMENQATSLAYDCNSCMKDIEHLGYFETYTYTINEKPGSIYLCGMFWKAASIGTESQAGLIIRELSHFAETETLDLAYGPEGARTLVAEDAWLGIMNADNYMYFAEKNPALSFVHR